MKSIFNLFFKLLLLLFCAGLLYSCDAQKDTFMNRRLHNLTARYNYLYNANLLLEAYREDLSGVTQENFEDIIPVYPVPDEGEEEVSDSRLDAILAKTETIIIDKSLSNYLDEAYMLIGKVNFYQKNYFNAESHFEYVATNYSDKPSVQFNALTWKARALIELHDYKNAEKSLDIVLQMLSLNIGERDQAFATLSQLAIKRKDYDRAITYLKAAINTNTELESRTRWMFILGQLYEIQKDYENSLVYYNKAENSNASYEIYFNAKLGKIRIGYFVNKNAKTRMRALLRLLKDDNNESFIDQVYFHIGEIYAENNDFKSALNAYQSSVNHSSNNGYQKGKSYLRMADINLKKMRQYTKAKLYYDSALAVLPETYPNYQLLVKKSKNLDYLSKRYEVIAQEDTAQYLVSLPEKERYIHIRKLLAIQDEKENKKEDKMTTKVAPKAVKQKVTKEISNFYFSNEAAISVGFSDFKKKWGNRKREDDWRRSQKPEQAVVVEAPKVKQEVVVQKKIPEKVSAGQSRMQLYIDSLPFTLVKLDKSNQKIMNAYYEIGLFYQQELDDKEEAIKTFETLLDRFGANPRIDAVYYSLYLLYRDINRNKSEQYKALILDYYPNSIYVKAILEASTGKAKMTELAVNADYNEVFSLYEGHQFQAVIDRVNQSLATYPNNYLEAQYAYLKAISIGHTHHVANLMGALNAIVEKYPTDMLITPLTKNHLEYLKNNMAEYQPRPIALPDNGSIALYRVKKPNFDVIDTVQRITKIAPKVTDTKDSLSQTLSIDSTRVVALSSSSTPVLPAIKPSATALSVVTPSIAMSSTAEPTGVNPSITAPPVATALSVATVPVVDDYADVSFVESPNSPYYYVISVADISLTLTSSRYGIGQFNGGNFPDDELKHKLVELSKNQMIFVGTFKNRADAKVYEKRINTQLKKIMKVPSNIYSSFVISKENFERLTTDGLLNKYQSYYHKINNDE